MQRAMVNCFERWGKFFIEMRRSSGHSAPGASSKRNFGFDIPRCFFRNTVPQPGQAYFSAMMRRTLRYTCQFIVIGIELAVQHEKSMNLGCGHGSPAKAQFMSSTHPAQQIADLRISAKSAPTGIRNSCRSAQLPTAPKVDSERARPDRVVPETDSLRDWERT